MVPDLLLVGAVAGGLAEPGQPAVHQRTGPAPLCAAAVTVAAVGRLLLVRLDCHLEGGGDVVSLKFRRRS